MKHLFTAIKIIKDCCTRREEFKESNYKQLLDLLPLGDSCEDVLEGNLHILTKENSTPSIKIRSFDKNKSNQNYLNNNIIYELKKANKDDDNENKNIIENGKKNLTHKNKALSRKKNADKNSSRDEGKNCSNKINNENEIKKLKEKIIYNNVYCAYGKLYDANSTEKHLKLKKIEIIPKFEREENIMNSFSVVCMRGNQNEFYNTSTNCNDDIYFNNYEQFFFIKAYDLKITGIISGIGKNSISVCDSIAFHLLKTILINLKDIYKTKKNIWLSDQIEYVLLLSITETNNYIKINLQESFNSGCSLCVCAYSKKHELLTVLNIGNIQTILVKNTDKKKESIQNYYTNETPSYETILVTKSHDILNEEEKERMLSYGCIINEDSENKNKNTWKNIEYLNQFYDKTDLKTLNITKAIGLFNFNKYGLLNTPDIIDVKLNINTNGFLILVSHTISQVYNSSSLVRFLFNKSNNNSSLFESSKKLIHNVHSIYMSTENNKVKDMTIIILPLID